MSLKTAASVAFAGMILLSVVVLLEFVRDASAAINGLIPAFRMLTSLIYLLASLALTVFFFVFSKKQN